MVQTVKTVNVPPGKTYLLFEKPHILQRVFFSVQVVLSVDTDYPLYVSFGDIRFVSYYRLSGQNRYFEAKGDDIFQGAVWACNQSNIGLNCALTEILH